MFWGNSRFLALFAQKHIVWGWEEMVASMSYYFFQRKLLLSLCLPHLLSLALPPSLSLTQETTSNPHPSFLPSLPLTGFHLYTSLEHLVGLRFFFICNNHVGKEFLCCRQKFPRTFHFVQKKNSEWTCWRKSRVIGGWRGLPFWLTLVNMAWLFVFLFTLQTSNKCYGATQSTSLNWLHFGRWLVCTSRTAEIVCVGVRDRDGWILWADVYEVWSKWSEKRSSWQRTQSGLEKGDRRFTHTLRHTVIRASATHTVTWLKPVHLTGVVICVSSLRQPSATLLT